MKVKITIKIIAGVFFIIAFSGCYKESSLIPANSKNKFHIDMPDTTMKRVLDSRYEHFYLLPAPQLYFNGTAYKVDHIKTRGASALNFQRKSLSVNLDDYLIFTTNSGEKRLFEKFKLISMVFDYTYLENRLSHILLNKINLWPLHSFYTELIFNRKHHQGLYLFIEDPEDFALFHKEAEVIMRRYYYNAITDIKLHPSVDQNSESYYINEFTNLYEIITQYKGEELFEELARRINIADYMRKMAFDYIIKNGDYTDEIYFYGSKKNDSIYFDIIPWDYDDIFADLAHEVVTDGYTGKVFGIRKYNNEDEHNETLNGRLVFSIEDDLDYIITIDDYMYSKYLEELLYVLSIINEHSISAAFAQVRTELDYFYECEEIIAQSIYDKNETNKELYENNIQQKETFLINRIKDIGIKLNEQISKH